MDDVVDQPWWSRVGGEFWNGKCALLNPLNQVIAETQSNAGDCAQTMTDHNVCPPQVKSPSITSLEYQCQLPRLPAVDNV